MKPCGLYPRPAQVVVTIHGACPSREDKLQPSSLVLPPPPSTVLPAICRRPVAKFGTHNEARKLLSNYANRYRQNETKPILCLFVFFLYYELPHRFFCSPPYFLIACFFNGTRPQKHSLLTSSFYVELLNFIWPSFQEPEAILELNDLYWTVL
jgi:hypothetical protein